MRSWFRSFQKKKKTPNQIDLDLHKSMDQIWKGPEEVVAYWVLDEGREEVYSVMLNWMLNIAHFRSYVMFLNY